MTEVLEAMNSSTICVAAGDATSRNSSSAFSAWGLSFAPPLKHNNLTGPAARNGTATRTPYEEAAR